MEPVYKAVIGIARATFALKRWDIRVTGLTNVPSTGGAVIASNHIGYLDFVFVGAGLLETPERRLVRFAAKQEAFDHPVSGPLMRAMKHIPVDRAGSATDAIDHGVRLLEQGELVGMFPEGTISRSFVPMPARTGTVRMAQRAGAPIVPCAVWGSQRLMTKGRPRNLRSDVVISVDYGEPLHPHPDDDADEVSAEMMAAIGKLVTAAEERYPQRPEPTEDPWWLPTHLGGTAPTPEEAERLAAQERDRRRARRAQRDTAQPGS